MTEFNFGNFKVIEVRTDSKDHDRNYELHYFSNYVLGPTSYLAASKLAFLFMKLENQQNAEYDAGLPEPTKR